MFFFLSSKYFFDRQENSGFVYIQVFLAGFRIVLPSFLISFLTYIRFYSCFSLYTPKILHDTRHHQEATAAAAAASQTIESFVLYSGFAFIIIIIISNPYNVCRRKRSKSKNQSQFLSLERGRRHTRPDKEFLLLHFSSHALLDFADIIRAHTHATLPTEQPVRQPMATVLYRLLYVL